MDVVVRSATPEDLDAVIDLRRSVAEEGVWIGAEAPIDEAGDREKHRQTVDDGVRATLLVAEVDGAIAGSLFVGASIEGIFDVGMNVAEAHRGRGIGRALIEAGIDWARAAGAHKLTLQHWPWNARARRLYERVGFVEEGYLRRHYRRRDGSLWDAVVMGLVLDDTAAGHERRAAHPPT